MDLGGAGGRWKPRGRLPKKTKLGYTPSLKAVFFRKKVKRSKYKKPKKFTHLSLRPILVDELVGKKKKKKRGKKRFNPFGFKRVKRGKIKLF